MRRGKKSHELVHHHDPSSSSSGLCTITCQSVHPPSSSSRKRLFKNNNNNKYELTSHPPSLLPLPTHRLPYLTQTGRRRDEKANITCKQSASLSALGLHGRRAGNQREGLLGVDFDWATQTDTSWLRNYTFLAIDKESTSAASLVLATKTGKAGTTSVVWMRDKVQRGGTGQYPPTADAFLAFVFSTWEF